MAKQILHKPNEKGCKICISHTRNNWKYPKMKVNGITRPVVYHLWEAKNGPIPHNHILKNTCNEDFCIELSHWYLVEGRRGKGVVINRKPRNILTESQRTEILFSTDSTKALAERYQVSQSAIYQIRRNKLLVNQRIKLTCEDILEIMNSPDKNTSLASRFNVASNTIYLIKNGIYPRCDSPEVKQALNTCIALSTS